MMWALGTGQEGPRARWPDWSCAEGGCSVLLPSSPAGDTPGPLLPGATLPLVGFAHALAGSLGRC